MPEPDVNLVIFKPDAAVVENIKLPDAAVTVSESGYLIATIPDPPAPAV